MSPRYDYPWYWSPGTTVLFWQVVLWTIINWGISIVVVPPELKDYRSVVVFAVAAAQCATVAGWLALGDGTILLRLTFVVPAVVFTAAWGPGRLHFAEAAGVVAIAIVVWSAPLALLRWFGWSCRPADDEAGPQPLRPSQFRIGHVLVLMTVLGVGLGVARLLPLRVLEASVGLAAASGLVGVIPWALWLTFLQKENFGPLGMIIVAFAWVVPLLFNQLPPEDARNWTGLVLLSTMTLGLNLLILRAGGYRLVRAGSGEQRKGLRREQSDRLNATE